VQYKFAVISLLHLLLDLDLEKINPNLRKERRSEVESKKSTSCGATLHQIQGQNLPPLRMVNIRVLKLKTLINGGRNAGRRRGGRVYL
jgi:hypothetical protein